MSEPMDDREQSHQEVVDTGTLADGVRAKIVAQLPEDWSTEEIDHFLANYVDRIDTEGEVINEVSSPEPEPEPEPEPTSLAPSVASRDGLTLDSYVIIDGRSVSLRAAAEAGRLYPYSRNVREGSRRFPIPRVQYEARLIDRNRVFIITEETFRTLHPDYPQTVPLDEPVSEAQAERMDSPVTIVKADKLERTFKRD